MPTTFVIGATGYIGGAFSERRAADGHTVRALAHTAETEAELRRRGHTPVPATLSDLDVLRQEAANADAVVWSVLSLNPADYPLMEGALAALNDALADSNKPLLYMGAGMIYAAADEPIGEDGPLDLSDPVSVSVARIEGIALEGAARGVRNLGIRSSLVYGRGGGMFMRGPIEGARAAGVARYVGTGQMKMSTVHLDDLVDLLVRALRDGSAGAIYNAAGGSPVTTLELAGATARAAGIDTVASVPPEQAYEVLGFMGGIMARNMWLSSDRARDELGWAPGGPSVLDDLTAGSYVAR